MVAERFRACVKFKYMLTQRPWFESHSRHDNLYGRIYMVTIAPAIIVVPLSYTTHRNLLNLTLKPKELAKRPHHGFLAQKVHNGQV